MVVRGSQPVSAFVRKMPGRSAGAGDSLPVPEPVEGEGEGVQGGRWDLGVRERGVECLRGQADL